MSLSFPRPTPSWPPLTFRQCCSRIGGTSTAASHVANGLRLPQRELSPSVIVVRASVRGSRMRLSVAGVSLCV